MPTSGSLIFTREQLLEAIDDRLKWAREYDIRAQREHRKAEQAALVKFREKLKQLSKMSYDEITETMGKYGEQVTVRFPRPRCPEKFEAQLLSYRKTIEVSRAANVTVSSPGVWDRLYYLLTVDPDLEAQIDAC